MYEISAGTEDQRKATWRHVPAASQGCTAIAHALCTCSSLVTRRKAICKMAELFVNACTPVLLCIYLEMGQCSPMERFVAFTS